MENFKFKEDKIFGDVFCRYLKKKFNWEYEAIDPQKIIMPNNYPDIDVVLSSDKKESLYLQLKQPIKFVRCEYILSKPTIKAFDTSESFYEAAIEKAENKYLKQGVNICDTILILHLGRMVGYSIKTDGFSVNKENCKKRNFKGIYLVSPSHKFTDGRIQDEFVIEFKDAFI